MVDAVDGFLLLRGDGDVHARHAEALSLAEALRPLVGCVHVELGGTAPARTHLIDRARSLGLEPADDTGVAWQGSAQDPDVWAWAVACLPVASWWHLYDGPTHESELIAYASDSLACMCLLASVAPEDPRGWLVAD